MDTYEEQTMRYATPGRMTADGLRRRYPLAMALKGERLACVTMQALEANYIEGNGRRLIRQDNLLWPDGAPYRYDTERKAFVDVRTGTAYRDCPFLYSSKTGQYTQRLVF